MKLTLKYHLNQASFAPPTKFVIFLCMREITYLCFKMPCNNKGWYDGSIICTRYSTQRINLESYTALEVCVLRTHTHNTH